MNKLRLIPLKQSKINDPYWNRYINLVRSDIIPYQWRILNDEVEDVETSHCIYNFKIAAGQMEGEYYGAVFQDTDLAKWIEAASYSLAVDPEESLSNLIDEAIDLIEKAQQKDGYLNTYYTIKEPGKRFTNLMEGHELYTAGHFMEAAVAYYQATGKRKLLDIICGFADLICQEFSKGRLSKAYPGHQEVEIGLYKLYEVTGHERYLHMAKEFLERRGQKPNYFLEETKKEDFHYIFDEFKDYDLKYSQCHLPVREQETAEGHAVRATYMYCAMADIAYEYQDRELFHACETIWNNIVHKRMYLTGSIGSSGILERFTTDYDLPNNCNYSETCASIGLALFGRRMAQITHDSKYIDVVELALYNTLLSGIAQDGKSFFYVNPLEVWPQNLIPRTSKEHVKSRRQKWFGVACCPPNIARTLASLAQYIYFQAEDRIYVNLFISSTFETEEKAKEGAIVEIVADYPRNEAIVINIHKNHSELRSIAVRIPEYVNEYQFVKNGEEMRDIQIEKGYAILSLESEEETIRILYPSKPRFVRANSRVKEDLGKVAVMKGPVVYCMEQVDNEANLPAYYILTDKGLQEAYDADLLGGTNVIYAQGKKIEDTSQENQLYHEYHARLKDTQLKLIPYPYWANREEGEMLVWIKEFFS